MQEFDDAAWIDKDYSEATTRQPNDVEKQWYLYYGQLSKTGPHKRDPKDYMKSANVALLYKFFDWYMNQKTGDRGRKKRGTKKASSLGTYWLRFRLIYERALGAKIPEKLGDRMLMALKSLATQHKLPEQRRANRPIAINTLKDLNKDILGTMHICLKLGEIRILVVLFLLLMAPAGSRPMSILKMKFGDIDVALSTDPEGGPPKSVPRFTLAYAKTYLGEKDHKTHRIPEDLYDPRFLANTQVFLVSILFYHKAFDAPTLASPERLEELDILHPGEFELPLPLKDELRMSLCSGGQLSAKTASKPLTTKPITYAMMNAWVKGFGEQFGLEHSLTSCKLIYF